MLIALKLFSQKVTVLDEKFSYCSINDRVLNPTIPKNTKTDIDKILALDQRAFIPNKNKQDINFGFDQRYAWTKFKIKNINPNNRYYLICIEQSRVDSVQLFVDKNKDSIEPKKPMGRHIKYLERVVPDRNYIYPIIIPKNNTYTYYLYTTRKYGSHAITIKLRTRESQIDYNSRFDIGAGGMIFTLLFTSFLGLILYGFIREKTYLFYAQYCFFTLLVLISDAGFVHTYVKNEALQGIINISTTISFYFAAALHIIFTLEILKSKSHDAAWFYNLGKISYYIFIVFAILLLLPIPDFMNSFIVRISYYVVFFMDIYIASAIVLGIKRRQESAYFYMIGFFSTLFFITILTLSNLGILDTVNGNSDFFYFIPLFEIFIILVGLCVRFESILKEQLAYQTDFRKAQEQVIKLQAEEQKNIATDLKAHVEDSLEGLKSKFFGEFRINDVNATQKIIDNLQNITNNIMPVESENKSLCEMIDAINEQYKSISKINFIFDCNKKSFSLDSAKEVAICKVYNELLKNIHQHAGANEVTTKLNFQKNYLEIAIEDDGIPFSLQKTAPTATTTGIRNIYLRLNFIQADIISTTTQNGNKLKINIPYHENNIIIRRLSDNIGLTV
ncbi:MAG: hypothetical protein KA313_07345 [Pseudarcicella sp.]|nr:hypothetical protein [Pseudarcicella sp.]MBP6410893.1 hypothetical protein [Pseudarcicella sp.]